MISWLKIDAFAPAKGPPPRDLVPFARWALSGAWPCVGIAAILSIIVGALEVWAAILLGYVVDAALQSDPVNVFSENAVLLIFALGFFVFLRPILLGISAFFQTVLTQPNMMNLILSRLHRYTLGQAVTFFDDDFAGRIAQKEMQTARALNDVVIEILHTVLFALASVVAAVFLLGAVDWRIAAGLSVWLVCYILLIRHFMPKIRARSTERAASRANVTGQIVDTVTNIKTVKLFAHHAHEDQAALLSMADYRQKFIAFGYVSVAFRFWLMTLAGILPVLLIGGALLFWSNGLITAGEIAATGAVALRLAQMTGWVSFTLMGLYANVGEVEDGIKTLTPPHSLLDKVNAAELSVPHGEIKLEHVSFEYGRENGGIRDVSLTVRPGEKLGVVGASGAGKSTLVSVLLRLYDVEDGAVLIDGQNVADVTQESLRSHIGMVTQETAMFNRSAHDNIAYGRPGATKGDVIKAAQKAEAHDFILGLQDHRARKGYDAFLGERGVKLSGGQRQRIALARAMLKDAPILILDEATSALDSEVEASIQMALETAMVGKTVLAIAHRLSTIARMDRIIVLDAGQIVEDGTHTELLALDGLYARYWQRQSGGFIGIDQAAE